MCILDCKDAENGCEVTRASPMMCCEDETVATRRKPAEDAGASFAGGKLEESKGLDLAFQSSSLAVV